MQKVTSEERKKNISLDEQKKKGFDSITYMFLLYEFFSLVVQFYQLMFSMGLLAVLDKK